MISRSVKIAFLLAVVLSACTTTTDTPLTEPKPINSVIDNLPVITQVNITAPCFLATELLDLLKAQNYTIFNQIINSSNGYLLITFRKMTDVAKYLVIVRAPPLACVIAGGVGISGA